MKYDPDASNLSSKPLVPSKSPDLLILEIFVKKYNKPSPNSPLKTSVASEESPWGVCPCVATAMA